MKSIWGTRVSRVLTRTKETGGDGEQCIRTVLLMHRRGRNQYKRAYGAGCIAGGVAIPVGRDR